MSLNLSSRGAGGNLIGCDCLLVQAIVSELYSEGEMEWLKGQPYKN